VEHRQPSFDRPGDADIENLRCAIRTFLGGDDVRFDTGILDLDRCSPFQRNVLLAEYGIPRGRVSTYGRIARQIGIPAGARAVGSALARNPFPIVIPCHRAVQANGRIGGFQGGSEMKRRLLGIEGVRFRTDGRVVMDRVWY
jgi:methylated-DNA-[protein]-cysteine S-methyltransferase